MAPCPLPPLPRFSQQQSFVQILQEVNDFAGQRELVAENLSIRVCLELAKYSQEMKQERKMVSGPCPGFFGGSLGAAQVSPCPPFPQHFQEGRRAQQQLESGFKQLENVSSWVRSVALVPGSRVNVADLQSCPLCLARTLPPPLWVSPCMPIY